MSGALVLMPNALDLGADLGDLRDVVPLGAIRRAARIAHWAAEDVRSARGFLKRVHEIVPLEQALQSLDIRALPRPRKGSREPVPPAEWQALLAPALAGRDVAVLSEAGLPGVADPGAALVSAAHDLGITVLPLAGPSSITLALAASGLNGQHFAFSGYLPQEALSRAQRVRELESLSRSRGQTQVVIEAPYRNAAVLDALLSSLAPDTRLSVSCGLTLANGWSKCCSVASWRALPRPAIDKVPSIFCFSAS